VEVHLHAGVQGFWVARLAKKPLGADVVLCCALGGEPERVLRGLIESEPLTLTADAARRQTACTSTTGATPPAKGRLRRERTAGSV
jgi:hypothetical protein